MNLIKLLQERRDLIDKALNRILPKESAKPGKLHKAMRYSVFSGGKRIRPVLVIESCLCCGGAVNDAIDAACAIELVHTFSLIHDDLPGMDDDNYRRGKLACHRKFDEATAILAGDALLTLAFEVLARGRAPGAEIKLIRELAASIGSLGIAGGQYVDIEYTGRKKDAKILNYINEHKTGMLIKASLKMGALASGAASGRVKALETFGRYTGEAFQIVDDILDGGDSVKVFGKKDALNKARLLTSKANAALDIFKDKADELKTISDYLIKRRF